MGRSGFSFFLGLLALGIMAGCGATMPPQSGLTRDTAQRRWIAPDAGKSKQILFESDYHYGTVEMFSIPNLKLKGIIGGFSEPQGLCADTKGNVWVVDNGSHRLTQLSHQGKVLQSFADLSGFPGGCAVNPTNGDLAVTNVLGNTDVGNVVIYKHASSGSPTLQSCKPLFYYYFVGFDLKNTLYVDGANLSGKSFLCSGKEGDLQLAPVRVMGAVINNAYMVQWYEPKKYLALGDFDCGGTASSCIYKLTISRNTATVIGSTKPLTSSGQPLCGLVQGVISPGKGEEVFGGNLPTSSCTQPASVNRWRYPSGGNALDTYANPNVVSEPEGAALSVEP